MTSIHSSLHAFDTQIKINDPPPTAQDNQNLPESAIIDSIYAQTGLLLSTERVRVIKRAHRIPAPESTAYKAQQNYAGTVRLRPSPPEWSLPPGMKQMSKIRPKNPASPNYCTTAPQSSYQKRHMSRKTAQMHVDLPPSSASTSIHHSADNLSKRSRSSTSSPTQATIQMIDQSDQMTNDKDKKPSVTRHKIRKLLPDPRTTIVAEKTIEKGALARPEIQLQQPKSNTASFPVEQKSDCIALDKVRDPVKPIFSSEAKLNTRISTQNSPGKGPKYPSKDVLRNVQKTEADRQQIRKYMVQKRRQYREKLKAEQTQKDLEREIVELSKKKAEKDYDVEEIRAFMRRKAQFRRNESNNNEQLNGELQIAINERLKELDQFRRMQRSQSLTKNKVGASSGSLSGADHTLSGGPYESKDEVIYQAKPEVPLKVAVSASPETDDKLDHLLLMTTELKYKISSLESTYQQQQSHASADHIASTRPQLEVNHEPMMSNLSEIDFDSHFDFEAQSESRRPTFVNDDQVSDTSLEPPSPKTHSPANKENVIDVHENANFSNFEIKTDGFPKTKPPVRPLPLPILEKPGDKFSVVNIFARRMSDSLATGLDQKLRFSKRNHKSEADLIKKLDQMQESSNGKVVIPETSSPSLRYQPVKEAEAMKQTYISNIEEVDKELQVSGTCTPTEIWMEKLANSVPKLQQEPENESEERLSPKSLSTAFVAQLNMLDAVQESRLKLSEMERVRAEALSQQETIAVATTLMTHRDRGQVPSVVEVDSAAENLKTPVEPTIVQKTMDVSEEIAGNEQIADSIGSSFEDLFGTPPEFDLVGLDTIESHLSKEKEFGRDDEALLNLRERTIEEHARSELAYLRQKRLRRTPKKNSKEDKLLIDMENAIIMRLATEKAEIKSRRMELAEQRKKEAQAKLANDVSELNNALTSALRKEHQKRKPSICHRRDDERSRSVTIEEDIATRDDERSRSVTIEEDIAAHSSKENSSIIEDIAFSETVRIAEDIPTEIEVEEDIGDGYSDTFENFSELSHSRHSKSPRPGSAFSNKNGESERDDRDSDLDELVMKLDTLRNLNDKVKIEEKQEKLQLVKQIAKELLSQRKQKLKQEKALKEEIFKVNEEIDRALDGQPISDEEISEFRTESVTVSRKILDGGTSELIADEPKDRIDVADIITKTTKEPCDVDEKEVPEVISDIDEISQTGYPDMIETNLPSNDLHNVKDNIQSPVQLKNDDQNGHLESEVIEERLAVEDSLPEQLFDESEEDIKDETEYLTSNVVDEQTFLENRDMTMGVIDALNRLQADVANSIRYRLGELDHEHDQIDRFDELRSSNEGEQPSNRPSEEIPTKPTNLVSTAKTASNAVDGSTLEERADVITQAILEDLIQDTAEFYRSPANSLAVEERPRTPLIHPSMSLTDIVKSLELSLQSGIKAQSIYSVPPLLDKSQITIQDNSGWTVDYLCNLANELLVSVFEDAKRTNSVLLVPRRMKGSELVDHCMKKLRTWVDRDEENSHNLDQLIKDEMREEELSWKVTEEERENVRKMVFESMWDDLLLDLVRWLDQVQLKHTLSSNAL